MRATILAVVLLACAGCGEPNRSDDQKSSAASSSESAAGGEENNHLITQADRICRKRIGLIDAALSSQGLTLRAQREIADAYEEELAALRSLRPPSRARTDYRRMVDFYADGTRAQGAAVKQARKVARATSREDSGVAWEGLTEAMTSGRRARAHGNEIARRIGLETCATPLY